MILLGILLLFAPPVALILTLVVAFRLLKTRRVVGYSLIALNLILALLMLWEFQYDLGIRLPDLGAFHDVLVTEVNLFVLVSLILAMLLVALVKWSGEMRSRWLAILAAALWAAILGAGLFASQINFMH